MGEGVGGTGGSLTAVPGYPVPPQPGVSPWHADGWVLLRRNGPGAGLAAGAGGYGGSQAGAVLRYSLPLATAHRTAAYVRVTGALDGSVTDRHVAAGIMARPLPTVPGAILAEVRWQNTGTATLVRPVIMAVSQLAPQPLAHGVEAEVYAQAGWAGGRDATAFFDVQATAERTIATPLPTLEVRGGIGAWSGGQEGAARLDIGPRLSLRTAAAGIAARVSLDWRLRVAGRAEPGSGPALTVAAGF